MVAEPTRLGPLPTEDIAADLLESYKNATAAMQHVNSYELPSTEAVGAIIEKCRALIFPGFVGPSLARATPTELQDHVRERLDELRNTMRKQLYRGLHHKVQSELGRRDLDCPHCAAAAAEITDAFLSSLVDLRALIATDVQAAYESDPRPLAPMRSSSVTPASTPSRCIASPTCSCAAGPRSFPAS